MRSRNVRLLVSVMVIVLFVCWTIWYVRGHMGDFRVLLRVRPLYVSILTVLGSACLVCNGLYIKYISDAFGLRLRSPEWMSLAVVTAAANYVTPLRGGAGLRALYLKTRYGFGIVDYLTTLAATFVIYVFINGIMGVVSLLSLWRHGFPLSVPLLLLFGFAALTALAIMTVRVRIPEFRSFPLKQFADLYGIWARVAKDRVLCRRLTINTALFLAFTTAEFKVAFLAFGLKLPWDSVLFYTSGQCMATLVTITPGALGVAETLGVYIGHILNYTTAQTLMVQGLWRVVTLAIIFLSAPFGLHFLGLSRVGGGLDNRGTE